MSVKMQEEATHQWHNHDTDLLHFKSVLLTNCLFQTNFEGEKT